MSLAESKPKLKTALEGESLPNGDVKSKNSHFLDVVCNLRAPVRWEKNLRPLGYELKTSPLYFDYESNIFICQIIDNLQASLLNREHHKFVK